jgi:hypothetical protein
VRRIALLAAHLVGVACSSGVPLGSEEHGPPLDPANPEEDAWADVQPEARFVGEWQVSQPFHALYEETFYSFGADGKLAHGRTCTFGAPADFETGVVGHPATRVQCLFGTRWASEGLATLLVEGVCDDDRSRAILLGFPADTSANTQGTGPVEVLSVGGEPGWVHASFEWWWRRCEPPSGCQSFCSP